MKVTTKLLLSIVIGSMGAIIAMQPTNDKLQQELVTAAKKGNIAGIKAAREKRADLNTPFGPEKETALHAAAIAGQLDAVRWLMQEGAALNKQDAYGKTPFHKAIEGGNKPHFRIIQTFIEQGDKIDNPNLKDNDGNTILHESFIWPRSGYFVPEILKLEKIDVNAQNNKGKTPLHLALEHGLYDNARLLLDKQNIKLDLADNEGNTPLHTAVKMNVDSAIVETLIKKAPFIINAQNKAGFTPLHLLVQEMNRDIEHAQKRPSTDAQRRIEEDKKAMAFLFGTKILNADLKDTKGNTALALAEGTLTRNTLLSFIEVQ